jgi:predicted DNA-binding transcriptional regulator YafY
MYHPTGRVLTVLELLQSRPGLTGPELAARLETDVRTVRRYVTKLQDVGIPVEATPGRYGGYRLRPGYKLPPLIFSETEATAIVLGLLGSSWLELEQSPSDVDAALSKITRVLPQAARERVLAMSSVMFLSPYGDGARPDISLLLRLGDAIQARQCIDLSYRSEQDELTRRIVEPYGLVGWRGKWYLVGWCRLRRDYRTFRLDRMQEVALLSERFHRDEAFDFRTYAMNHLENWPVNRRFRVLFRAPLSRVRDRIGTNLGSFTETPQGIELAGATDELVYAARLLLRAGLPFRVLEPEDLRDALIRVAERTLELARSA